MTDLQKANFGKRIVAAIFDGILLSILAVGLATLLSSAFGYDGYMNTLNSAYDKYDAEYGVELRITQQEYNALTEQEKLDYEAANKALNEDQDALYAWNMMINLTILILIFSVLIAVAVIEFIIPLFFGNGQTLGKKIFSIGVMHKDGIQVRKVQLFARSILGKYAIELMIPLAIIVLVFLGAANAIGITIMLALFIGQIGCLIITNTNSAIHDVLSNTVVVDITSQKIFRTKEDLLEYTKKIHADRAERQIY